MNTRLSISSQAKMGLGSALATVGVLLAVLTLLLGWSSALPGPWDFILGFATGLFAGVGAAMGLKGMIEHRRER